MAHSKISVLLVFVLLAAMTESKIVLPHKLRYLENMLNADLISKATKMRRSDPNTGLENRSWPALGLGKYQDEEKSNQPQPLPPFLLNNIAARLAHKKSY